LCYHVYGENKDYHKKIINEPNRKKNVDHINPEKQPERDEISLMMISIDQTDRSSLRWKGQLTASKSVAADGAVHSEP